MNLFTVDEHGVGHAVIRLSDEVLLAVRGEVEAPLDVDIIELEAVAAEAGAQLTRVTVVAQTE